MERGLQHIYCTLRACGSADEVAEIREIDAPRIHLSHHAAKTYNLEHMGVRVKPAVSRGYPHYCLTRVDMITATCLCKSWIQQNPSISRKPMSEGVNKPCCNTKLGTFPRLFFSRPLRMKSKMPCREPVLNSHLIRNQSAHSRADFVVERFTLEVSLRPRSPFRCGDRRVVGRRPRRVIPRPPPRGDSGRRPAHGVAQRDQLAVAIPIMTMIIRAVHRPRGDRHAVPDAQGLSGVFPACSCRARKAAGGGGAAHSDDDDDTTVPDTR